MHSGTVFEGNVTSLINRLLDKHPYYRDSALFSLRIGNTVLKHKNVEMIVRQYGLLILFKDRKLVPILPEYEGNGASSIFLDVKDLMTSCRVQIGVHTSHNHEVRRFCNGLHMAILRKYVQDALVN